MFKPWSRSAQEGSGSGNSLWSDGGIHAGGRLTFKGVMTTIVSGEAGRRFGRHQPLLPSGSVQVRVSNARRAWKQNESECGECEPPTDQKQQKGKNLSPFFENGSGKVKTKEQFIVNDFLERITFKRLLIIFTPAGQVPSWLDISVCPVRGVLVTAQGLGADG